jgi:ADP-ribosylation factor GTPase-activating protein 2/3
MKTIEQEGVVEKKPSVPSSSRGSSSMDADFFDDFQSGFSMYKGGNQTSESKSMNWGSFDSGTKDRSGGGSKGWTDQEPRRASSPQRRSSPVRNASSRQSREPTSSASGDEAQKKFGSAKAISSDQFFQDANSNDVSIKNACLKPIFYADILQWERKSNLQRFEGSSSISSSDYFNNGQQPPRGGSSSGGSGGYQPSMQSPDLDDMKESVRQGVTKVAGKLSNLANGVMNSFQVSTLLDFFVLCV